MGGRVCLTRQGAIALVTLDHPGKFNAMSRAMWRELRAVFTGLQTEPAASAARCVVLRGADGHFCAGGDISEYADFRFDEASLRAFHEDEVWGGLQAVLDCDVPVLAHIEGNCMGAGVEIASACDLRIAGASARFGAPIAKLGFPMAPREAALVTRATGEATARAMLLEAAVFDAAEMKARGFVQRLQADEAMADHVLQSALRIASLAPQAARLNKKTLRALGQGRPAETLVTGAYAYADSAEHREGIAAFTEKRKPDF
jgi:enoyl-CoA hydratase/carnithine racemase